MQLYLNYINICKILQWVLTSLLIFIAVLSEPDRGSLSVIATVFDKLNHEYKKYLEAEQTYNMASY